MYSQKRKSLASVNANRSFRIVKYLAQKGKLKKGTVVQVSGDYVFEAVAE